MGCSANAQTAIADLFVLQPDLILIDIGLASGSGFDVLETLQEHSLVPEAVKVVLTNRANTEYANLSRRLGADRFFDKSSETWQVVALIHGLAAERRRGGAAPFRNAPSLVTFLSQGRQRPFPARNPGKQRPSWHCDTRLRHHAG